MYDAAELQNILPRIHDALMHRKTRAIWRTLDAINRTRWCALAHLDAEVYATKPWETIDMLSQTKLDIAMNFADQIFTRLAELAPTRG